MSETQIEKLEIDIIEDEKKKSVRRLIKDYEESLSEALVFISPILKEKAIGGDMAAIKELHEIIGAKAGKDKQTIIPIQINIEADREKYK